MKNQLIILVLIVITQLSLTSCTDNKALISETSTVSSALQKEVLTNLSVDVIVETYADVQNNSRYLNTKAKNLTIGDEQALQVVKDAWKDARASWEKSKGFLFGPVVEKGIAPAIDTWPIDLNAINSILESGQKISSNSLQDNNTARGFHTIEYFVWGMNGNKSASELTQKEIEYIVAATENLKENARLLYIGWCHEGSYFASNFIDAGESTSIYSSQEDALKEIVKGMVAIADKVANEKIKTLLIETYADLRPEAIESRFSHTTKSDLVNNILGIQNIYLGNYENINGIGLSAIIVARNSTLDEKVKIAITDAITAIENISGTFTEAIVNNKSEIRNAQAKASELHALLETQLLPLISEL